MIIYSQYTDCLINFIDFIHYNTYLFTLPPFSFKNIEIVENVVNSLKNNRFRISLFPEYKIMGRHKKIAYNSVKNN